MGETSKPVRLDEEPYAFQELPELFNDNPDNSKKDNCTE